MEEEELATEAYLTEAYVVEDTPEVPEVQDWPEHDDTDSPARRRSPRAGDLLRRLEVLVAPVAELAATIEHQPTHRGPTLHG